jgi:hypothetical protein
MAGDLNRFWLSLPDIPLAFSVVNWPLCLPPRGHRLHGHGEDNDLVSTETQRLQVNVTRDAIHQFMPEVMPEIMPAALGMKIMPAFPLELHCVPA